MIFNPDTLRRRSIRLKAHDYSQAGAYFVTVCAQNRECVFGNIMGMEMKLNDAGRMVQSVWDELPGHYPGVQTDSFVIMPNHIHGIIVLTDPNVGAGYHTCPNQRDDKGQPRGVAPTLSLPDVVHRFKLMTTTRYRWGVTKCGWPPFHQRLWQRNYFERVVRDVAEMHRVREYITGNPARIGEVPPQKKFDPAAAKGPRYDVGRRRKPGSCHLNLSPAPEPTVFYRGLAK